MIQNEYRKLGKNYQFKANFGHTRNYNNSLLNEKNNISYLFSKNAKRLHLSIALGATQFEDLYGANNKTTDKIIQAKNFLVV